MAARLLLIAALIANVAGQFGFGKKKEANAAGSLGDMGAMCAAAPRCCTLAWSRSSDTCAFDQWPR